MNGNDKNGGSDIYPSKNLNPLFNQSKINTNKSYPENTKINLLKENISTNNIYNTSSSNSFDNIDENPNQVVSKILDNINKNSLSSFYDSDSVFKNKIDSLNLKFYLETEKYLCNQNKKIKTQTSLFIILFKQIIIYIEEIERLNLIIIQKKYKPENIIKRTDDITQKQKEFQTKEDIINALKKSQSNMEAKLLKALINENNLNKKIENLQKEIEVYKNKIISLTNNNEMQIIKMDKTISSSFQDEKNEDYSDINNKNGNSNINNKKISNNNINYITNKKKNSHNSVCFTNSSNNQINNIIKINKSINIKSKSPTNFNKKKSSFKLKNFKSLNSNTKRNHSVKDEKSKKKNNNNKNNNNKPKLKKLKIEEMKNQDYLITEININENIISNDRKQKIDKINKNNTIDIYETEPDLIKGNMYKKIIIRHESKLLKGDNIAFKNNKKNNNLNINLLLSNSNLPNNINSNKKQKNDLNINNKCIYNCYNTITNYNNKFKSDNGFNHFKLVKNGKKGNIDINNNNQSNNNINRIINKNMLNEQKSKSLLKKGKNIKNKIKNIINISNSIGINKDNNLNNNKKS